VVILALAFAWTEPGAAQSGLRTVAGSADAIERRQTKMPGFATGHTAVPLGANTVASDINNRLQVVGYVSDGSGSNADSWAVLWEPSGVRYLGVRVRGGLRINDLGIVVGIRVADNAGWLVFA
jgi:hypothetical protein